MKTSIFSSLSDLLYNNKAIFLLLFTVISFLMIDTMLIKTYVFTTTRAFLGYGLTIFVIIGMMYVVTQYIILKYIRKKSAKIQSGDKLHLDQIHKVAAITQVAIATILVIAIFQMIAFSRYSNSLIIICTTMSYALSIFLMTTLAKHFFAWYKSNRNLIIIFYAISSLIIALNAGLTLVFVDIMLLQQPLEARPHYGPVPPSAFFKSFSLNSIVNYAFIITTVVSFVSFWFSTALLLRHHSERLGVAKYWIVLSIPLFFFISQFMPLFVEQFSSLRQSDPITFTMIYTIIYTLSKPAGGILFGIAFWIVARSLPHNSAVRDYLIISAFGIVLLFTSNQAIILVSFTYPPFGLVTISFLGISSYLILVGIYSSAISVSQDVNLRKAIRNHALQEVKLLDSIGTAQMQQEIEMKVISFSKKTQNLMLEETGISPSLGDEDIKNYVQLVLEEIVKNKYNVY